MKTIERIPETKEQWAIRQIEYDAYMAGFDAGCNHAHKELYREICEHGLWNQIPLRLKIILEMQHLLYMSVLFTEIRDENN